MCAREKEEECLAVPVCAKVSIISVCFNSAETIVRMLRSVADQTWSEIEHIIIDGASSDATLRLVRQYGSRVGKVISEPDVGIYDAMNKGVSAASGEIICFLNSDDWYADGCVIRDVASLMENDDLDIVFGDVRYYDPRWPGRSRRRYRSDHFRPERIAWGWMPAHPALFVRREVFASVGAFRTDYRIAGDFEWITRVFRQLAPTYRYVPRVCVHMAVGGASTSGWSSTLTLNREVRRALRENGVRSNWAMILSKYPSKLIELVRK
jgi:glycosyltransferase involved in cell wall biosynthesis